MSDVPPLPDIGLPPPPSAPPTTTAPFPPIHAEEPPRRRSARGVLLAMLIAFLLGLAAMALGLWYYQRWWPARQASPAATAAPAQPVVIVPAQGGKGAPPPVIDLNDLATREGQLAQQLGALEARTASVGESAAAASGYATRAEAMLVALATRRQLDKGVPLGALEPQLMARFGAVLPGAVATVREAAAAPVTLEDLRAGLDAIAPDLVTGQSGLGWWGSLRRELSTLIVLHQSNVPSPLPAERLARGRRLLDAGQVAPALAEIARLPGAPQAANWTAAARRYVAARQALDQLESAAIGSVATAGAPS